MWETGLSPGPHHAKVVLGRQGKEVAQGSQAASYTPQNTDESKRRNAEALNSYDFEFDESA